MPADVTRRRLLCSAASAAALPLLSPLIAKAADPLPSGLDAAIDRGLAFLQKQQKEDGSFSAVGPANALCGLAILAYLCAGHTPDVGRYGLVVRKAVGFLLNRKIDNGYFGADGGRMYGHAIATLALAEAHGTETDDAQRRRVRQTLEKCLPPIFESQDVRKDKPPAAGGWRYELNSTDSDLSVSGWCIAAMRACQDAGLTIPRDRAERALSFVLACHNADQRAFAYEPGGAPTVTMTSVALLCLHLLDAADRVDAPRLEKFLVDRRVRADERFFYYAHYHATQAAYQAGGGTWDVVWKNTWEQLLPMQKKDDGSWPKKEDPGSDDRKGRVYSTAMACLALSVPLRLLPLYQR